ncbi:hypothetical protein BEP19_00235 [Ammoniphilus oxalaticus]|uniref:Capsule synthesis protein CapA domain-containing protein n=1 Tax=Ammoniphilus oxalaticus TaxID=66863 RepID=A0A419SR71_9BACL|nr:CapA family protein [Ammoniphilus oxalaticus]RKD27038.1 hypothetical protein BEP19_00235 [Ammoniphilus oxalaticus]
MFQVIRFMFLYSFFLVACQPQISINENDSTPVHSGDIGPTKEPRFSLLEPDPLANEPAIRLSFAGDTMMAGRVADVVEERGADFPFQDATPIFKESDLVMLNLKTTISNRGASQQKQYTFRSHPQLAAALKKAGVDLVSIANNHALDYGQPAFLDTLQYLREADVSYVGGGVDKDEAYASKTFTAKGKTVQFFGFSRVFPLADWHAGVKHPGMASAYDPTVVYNHVEEARQSGILQIKLQGEEIIPEFIPMMIELGTVRLANEQQTEVIMDRLQRLSIEGLWNRERIFEPAE